MEGLFPLSGSKYLVFKDIKQTKMKKTIILFLLTGLLMHSCKDSNSTIEQSSASSSEEHKVVLKNLLDFFDQHAYQNTYETYYSELNNEGKVISGKVYNVALSRLIYGLSYTTFLDTSYKEKAQKAINFQLKHLTAQDSIGGYFLSYTSGNIPKTTIVVFLGGLGGIIGGIE